MEIIYGYLERIAYYNEETSFMVGRLQEKGKKGLTTIVGNLAGINPGESLKLTGLWVHNSKFGEQFKVEKYEITVPATVNGVEKYLGSGLIKGIGPVMAKRIVKLFGLDTLEVIENKPGELSKVEGIGPKRIDMITEAWQSQKEIKEIMLFLQSHGVSAGYSAKIFKQYGKSSTCCRFLAVGAYPAVSINRFKSSRSTGFSLYTRMERRERMSNSACSWLNNPLVTGAHSSGLTSLCCMAPFGQTATQ